MIITMAHGSGGAETSALIRDVFTKHFTSPELRKMEDAAVLNVQGRIAYTTDSYVVTPLFFPGGDIGKLAVCGTANDLAMLGARPFAITTGFILETGLPLETLERVAQSMAQAAKKANVRIVAGDTKVIQGNGGLYINTSGIGMITGRPVRIASGKSGDAILVSGYLGDHHACILSQRMEVENNIESDAQPLYPIVQCLQQARIPLHGMRDITRGGLGTVLHEIAESCQCAIEIQETALPVSEAVQGFCGMLGLDPLYMGNEGKMVMIVPNESAEKALTLVHKLPEGRGAAIVGHLRDGAGVTLHTALGGSRYVEALQGEGLPRIC